MSLTKESITSIANAFNLLFPSTHLWRGGKEEGKVSHAATSDADSQNMGRRGTLAPPYVRKGNISKGQWLLYSNCYAWRSQE